MERKMLMNPEGIIPEVLKMELDEKL